MFAFQVELALLLNTYDFQMREMEARRKAQWQARYAEASPAARLEMIELERLRLAEEQLKEMKRQADAAESAAAAARDAARSARNAIWSNW